MTYHLSTFNKISYKGQYSTCTNSITKGYILYDAQVSELINKSLNQQLNFEEEKLEGKLLQIITKELLHKGIIIPDSGRKNEEDYLNSLIKFKQPTDNSFFRAQVVDELKLLLLDNVHSNIIFCGIPYDIGAKNPGTRFGPELLRQKSCSIMFRSTNERCLIDMQECADIFSAKNIYDLGDLYLDQHHIDTCLEKVKETSYQISKKGVPFFIGGDHLFTFLLVSGLHKARQKPFTLVQLDYHLDIQVWGNFKDNKPERLTSPTHANFISWIKHTIPEIDIFQIGIDSYQSIDKSEYKAALKYVNNLGSRITNKQIYLSIFEKIIKSLPKDQEIYLSIDVDVLNFVYLNATGYPSHTGIDLKDLLKIVNYICQHNKIIGCDIMEFGQSSKYESHTHMSFVITNIILEILISIKK